MIVKQIELKITEERNGSYFKGGLSCDVLITTKKDLRLAFEELAVEIHKGLSIIQEKPKTTEPPTQTKPKSKRKPIKVSPEPTTTPTPEQPPPIPKLLPKEELEALEDFISESRHAQYLRAKDRSWEGMDVKAWGDECWRWLAEDILQTKLPKPNELTTSDRDTIMKKLKERQ